LRIYVFNSEGWQELFLFIHKLGIEAFREVFEESFVGSHFNALSMINHEDFVSVSNCGKTMGDYNRGYLAELLPHLLNRVLNFKLILFVERTCCFIENEQFGLFNESTSKSDALLLATGKSAS